jgi:hypothetical protein
VRACVRHRCVRASVRPCGGARGAKRSKQSELQQSVAMLTRVGDKKRRSRRVHQCSFANTRYKKSHSCFGERHASREKWRAVKEAARAPAVLVVADQPTNPDWPHNARRWITVRTSHTHCMWHGSQRREPRVVRVARASEWESGRERSGGTEGTSCSSPGRLVARELKGSDPRRPRLSDTRQGQVRQRVVDVRTPLQQLQQRLSVVG